MKLTIVVDCGASLTKIVYRLWKSSKEIITTYEWMLPDLESVSAEELNEYFETKRWFKEEDPKRFAYLKTGDTNHVVGKFAKKFNPDDRIFELKYENALYKVMAAIGVILQKNGVKTKKALPTWIGVLLPWDEYSDRERFAGALVKMLSNYKFREQTIKIKASEKTLLVRPEGAGIYSSFVLQGKSEYFQDRKVGIAQFGHRNITGFNVDEGQVEEGTSPKIGWVTFLDEVVKNTSGLDRESLLKAICDAILESSIDKYTKNTVLRIYRSKWSHEAGKSNELVHYNLGRTETPSWADLEAIKSLATARDSSLREAEIKDIATAIDIALRKYRKQVRKWLDKTFPADLDCLIFSGGAAKLLLPELEDYCNSYRRTENDTSTRYVACYEYLTELDAEYGEYEGADDGYIETIGDSSLAARLANQLNMSEWDIEELSLDTRYVDPYGLFEYILVLEKQQLEKQKEAEKKAKVKAAKAAKLAEATQALEAAVAAREAESGFAEAEELAEAVRVAKVAEAKALAELTAVSEE